jgi:hypothetical protein
MEKNRKAYLTDDALTPENLDDGTAITWQRKPRAVADQVHCDVGAVINFAVLCLLMISICS